MTDEEALFATYRANYPDETLRLILADWLEERGDPRGTWLRDPELAEMMGPLVENPAKTIISGGATTEVEERLRKLGLIGIPSILETIRFPYLHQVGWLCWVLESFADLRPELPALIRELRTEDRSRQSPALKRVGEIGDEAAPAISAILDLFANANDSDLQEAALRTLMNLGLAGDWALRVANLNLEHRQYQKVELLHRIIVERGADSVAVAALASDLARPFYRTHTSAAESLKKLGPAVFDRVFEMWSSVPRSHRELVRDVLEATPDFRERLIHIARTPKEEWWDRVSALEVLFFRNWNEPIPEELDDLIPLLLELALTHQEALAVEAMKALHDFGPRAMSALPQLRQQLDDGNFNIRKAAEEAIRAIAGDEAN